MAHREPDPFAQCLPGGSCPVCNARVEWCDACGEVEVKREGDLCADCAAEDEEEEAQFDTCDWCGTSIDEGERFCSRGCARASESDHA